MRDVLVPVDGGVVLAADAAGVVARRNVRGAQVGMGEGGHYVCRDGLALYYTITINIIKYIYNYSHYNSQPHNLRVYVSLSA